MLTLLQTLQDQDLSFLQAVAEKWGIDLPRGTAATAAEAISKAFLQPEFLADLLESLPRPARDALETLLQHGGKMPLADALRRFGGIREMGPGRLDRMKPWRDPVSPLEMLWYRGLVGRAFLDTPSGPQEFLYLPEELRQALKDGDGPAATPPGEPYGGELSEPLRRSFAAVEDATTLLAGLRRRPGGALTTDPDARGELSAHLLHPETLPLLASLLLDLEIVEGPPLMPVTEHARTFLAQPDGQVLGSLLLAWRSSTRWNDLAHVPSLAAPNEDWPNDPLTARSALIATLEQVPRQVWWDLPSFVQSVKKGQPSFQRPAGDFDSWYLQHRGSGTFLRGYEHWDQVEGALLRFVVCGPLHWLGAADLLARSASGEAEAFRLTPASEILFDPSIEIESTERADRVRIRSDATLLAPVQTELPLRYQIARMSVWIDLEEEGYGYRLTPASLQGAREQGLTPSHIETLLTRAAEGGIPPSLRRALARWGNRGQEAALSRQMVLRVSHPDVLESLRSNRTTARLLGERLGPQAAVVSEGRWEDLQRAAAKMGLLVEPPESDAERSKGGGEASR